MVVSQKAMRRIHRDKTELQKNPLHSEGIYVLHDPNDLKVTRACIIGPEGTPYENGFYFFHITFPDNYPFSPPKVSYHTNDGNTRMHPNFYKSSKVCVSIIGTWTGPGWTSCQSLSSILLTFRSLMIENPLWQEPGFADKKDKTNEDYNTLIRHENLRIGILRMLRQTPKDFMVFKHIMYSHFTKHRQQTLDAFKPYCVHDDNILTSPKIYNFSKEIYFTRLLEEIGSLRKCSILLSKKKDQDAILDRLKNANQVDNSRVPYRDCIKALSLDPQKEGDHTDHTDNMDETLALLELHGRIKRLPGAIIEII